MAITAGVIGCGNISKFHFDGLKKAGATVAWVCDLNEEAMRPRAEEYGARMTTDYKEIIADGSVDMMVVTPVSSIHKPICLAAIDAGKAVVCEKTLAENAADALEIVKAAEEKGTLFYTSYMKRFIPAVVRAKELLPSLGTIQSSDFRVYQPWGTLWDRMPEQGPFHTPQDGSSWVKKNYGGGILTCGGSHILDLVGFFLGRPKKLFATMKKPPERDYDLQAAALMVTDNGPCHFESTAYSLGKAGFLRDGWDERFEITGVNGRLNVYSSLWDNPENKASLLVHYDNATGASTEYRFGPVSPFAIAIAHFVEQIEKGEQGPQSRCTGYDVDLLIETIHKSADTGEAVAVDYLIG